MGLIVRYHCPHCRYEEPDLGVGAGVAPHPRLQLFRCDNCHSVGSTWLTLERVPRCSFCYHDAVTLLPDDAPGVVCPKCGEPGRFERQDGEWQ